MSRPFSIALICLAVFAFIMTGAYLLGKSFGGAALTRIDEVNSLPVLDMIEVEALDSNKADTNVVVGSNQIIINGKRVYPASDSTAAIELTGREVVEDRAISDFQSVSNHSNGSIRVSYGAEFAVILTGDEAVLPHVTAENEEGVLLIRMDERTKSSAPFSVDVTMPNLEFLSQWGSGDTEIRGFNLAELKLELGGSGAAELASDVDVLSIKAQGSGDFTLSADPPEEVILDLLGSGNVKLAASKHLEAVIQGSGALDAGSHPTDKVEVRILGSGSANVDPINALHIRINGSGNILSSKKPALYTSFRIGSGTINFIE